MTPAEFEAAAQVAIAEIVGADGRMLTKFVLVVEALEPDGPPACWTATSAGLTDWDSLGLLEHALTRERAAVARRYQEDS